MTFTGVYMITLFTLFVPMCSVW